MISRLDRLQGRDIYENTALAKLNEVIDAVNELQEMCKSCDNQIGILAEQIAELQHDNSEKVNCQENVQDEFAEQRKWRGKICKFWDDSDEPENCVYDVLCNIFDPHHEDCPFQCGNGEWYEYCEPVKPDSELIYHGE